jgi:hypothetical protein
MQGPIQDIEEISDIRAPPNERMPNGEVLQNKVTLEGSIHKNYDRGEICFLPVPNWSMILQELESIAPRPLLNDAPTPRPPRGSFKVLYVNAKAANPREPAYYPTGQVCRLYQSSPYPPSWLLEITVARAFLITFGVEESFSMLVKDAEEAHTEILQTKTPEHIRSNSSHPSTATFDSPATSKSPMRDRPSIRSQNRSHSSTPVQNLDRLFWGLILGQARRARREADVADGQEEEEAEEDDDEEAPSKKVPAWLQTLPAKGKDYQTSSSDARVDSKAS